MITQQSIKAAVNAAPHPHAVSNQSLGDFPGLIGNITVSDDKVTVQLQPGYPAKADYDVYHQVIVQALAPLTALPVEIVFQETIPPFAVPAKLPRHRGIQNIIAVASGKGGVGKSTVSAYLAIALAQMGAKVGLLDADIYGPSIPALLKAETKAVVTGKRFDPVMRYGIQMISIGHLLADDKSPAIWRGPMASGALLQLLSDTNWVGTLDYLIVDLPPGTGDIQLTMAQKMPVTASVVVTTPQDLARRDAAKAIGMFRKVNLPVLGIIENMQYFQCGNCDTKHALFGQGAGAELSKTYGVPLIGGLPLSPLLQNNEGALPCLVADPSADVSVQCQSLALSVARLCAQLPRDMRLPVTQVTATT